MILVESKHKSPIMNANLLKSFEKVSKLTGSYMNRMEDGVSLTLTVSRFSDMEIEDIKSSIVHFAGLKKPIYFTVTRSSGNSDEDETKKFLTGSLVEENKLKIEKPSKKVMHSFTDASLTQLRKDIYKLEDLPSGMGYTETVDELFAKFYDGRTEKKQGKGRKEKEVYLVHNCAAFEGVYASYEDALAYCIDAYFHEIGYSTEKPILSKYFDEEGNLVVPEEKFLEECHFEISNEMVQKKKKGKKGKRESRKSARASRDRETGFTVENFHEYIDDWDEQGADDVWLTKITIDLLWQQRIHAVSVDVRTMDGDGVETGEEDEYEELNGKISSYVTKRVLEYPRDSDPEKLMIKFAKEMFEKKLLKKLGKRLHFTTDIGNDT